MAGHRVARLAVSRDQNCTGSRSVSSHDSQATCAPVVVAHSASRMVLPKPEGATTSTSGSLADSSLCSRATRCTLGPVVRGTATSWPCTDIPTSGWTVSTPPGELGRGTLALPECHGCAHEFEACLDRQGSEGAGEEGKEPLGRLAVFAGGPGISEVPCHAGHDGVGQSTVGVALEMRRRDHRCRLFEQGSCRVPPVTPDRDDRALCQRHHLGGPGAESGAEI